MENDTELEDELLGTEHEEETPDGAEKPDADKDEKTYTAEELQDLVQKEKTRFERAEKKLKQQLANASKKPDEDDLSEAEQLRQELDDYKRKELIRERESDVRSAFQSSEVLTSGDVLDNVVSLLIKDDEDETDAATEAVLELLKQERQAQAAKSARGKRTPPLDPSGTKKTESSNIGARLASKSSNRNGKAFE